MKPKKLLELKFERVIPAAPAEVYEAWLSSKVPGTPWSTAKKFILNPKVDGLFYWMISNVAHYGRFTKMKKGSLVEHTWMSPYTEGIESNVKVTFKKKGKDTLMTLVHSNLPDSEKGQAHHDGWHFMLETFVEEFGEKPKKKKK